MENDFYAKDKLAVTDKIRAGDFDLTKGFVGDMVNEAQAFVKAARIMPSETIVPEAVGKISYDKKNGFNRIYNNGRVEKIDEGTFMREVVYNYVPERFKTYNPNASSKQ